MELPGRRSGLLIMCGLLAAVLGLPGCERSQPIEGASVGNASLSPGICPIIHCDRAQSDAFDVMGPEAPSQTVGAETLDHLWSSPVAGGILDYIDPAGRRIFWVAQVDRIMKLALDEQERFVKLAEIPLEPKNFPRRSPEDMQRIVEEFDATPFGSEKWDALADVWMDYQLEALRAYYSMVNSAGVLYVGNRSSVIAYGDAIPGDPESGIVKVGEYVFEKLKLQLGLKMPLVIMIGMNVAPDGHIITVTVDGTVIAIAPDLSEGYYYSLEDEQIWNSIAVDDEGGIYVAGNKSMRKLIWTGEGFSDDPADGAWRLAYEVGDLDAALRSERGTGTTPALMGDEDAQDQFVVVADAANVNNLMLLWRDEIPEGWKPPAGAKDPRIAGRLPVDFGDATLENSYSENSATVYDYGAVLANNQVKTFEAMRMPVQLKLKDPSRNPSGLQKFEWDREAREFRVAWTRPDVSSPNSTPVVAMQNRQLHVVGLVDGKWSMTALDWDSGETRRVYTLGESERFNPIMLALQLLPNGDPVFATFGGIMHLKLGEGSAR